MALDVTISMDLKDLERLDVALKRASDAGADTSGPVSEFGLYWIDRTRRMFDESSAGSGGGRDEVRWKPLNAATIIRRMRKGQGLKILKVTGALQASIKIRRTQRDRVSGRFATHAVELYSDSPIARVHQSGSRKRGIPRRIIVFLTRSEIRDARELIRNRQYSVIKREVGRRL